MHSKTRPSDSASLAQRSILEGMRERIDDYGDCPADLSGQQALHALLKTDDLYVLGCKNLAPYDPAMLTVAKSEVLPKVATELLLLDSSKFLPQPDKYIVPSDAEMEVWRSAHPSFRPYWDPGLSADRSSRLELDRVLPTKACLFCASVSRVDVEYFSYGNLAVKAFV